MGDPGSEIRHLLGRYEEALSTRDLSTLADLHWQDERFTHVWSPGKGDIGWQAYEQRLEREFGDVRSLSYRFAEIRVEVFAGRFAVVNARWQCDFVNSSDSKGSRSGPVTFVLSRMGSSWKIVADHHSLVPDEAS